MGLTILDSIKASWKVCNIAIDSSYQMVSGLTNLNKWIRNQLTLMLKLEQNYVVGHHLTNPPIEPCWIESVQESIEHFDSLVRFLNGYYDFMAEKILRLRASSDVSYRIRNSG